MYQVNVVCSLVAALTEDIVRREPQAPTVSDRIIQNIEMGQLAHTLSQKHERKVQVNTYRSSLGRTRRPAVRTPRSHSAIATRTENAPRKLQVDDVVRSQLLGILAHTSPLRAVLSPHEHLLPIRHALGIHNLLLIRVRIRQVVHDDEMSQRGQRLASYVPRGRVAQIRKGLGQHAYVPRAPKTWDGKEMGHPRHVQGMHL